MKAVMVAATFLIVSCSLHSPITSQGCGSTDYLCVGVGVDVKY